MKAQNVASLEAHGFRRQEGVDGDGVRWALWRRANSRRAFGMRLDSEDTFPYLVDLDQEGITV